jgi:hypothetical protein
VVAQAQVEALEQLITLDQQLQVLQIPEEAAEERVELRALLDLVELVDQELLLFDI